MGHDQSPGGWARGRGASQRRALTRQGRDRVRAGVSMGRCLSEGNEGKRRLSVMRVQNRREAAGPGWTGRGDEQGC